MHVEFLAVDPYSSSALEHEHDEETRGGSSEVL
jgi:hypothetical protein